MKKLLFIVLLFVISCNECDSVRYQVHDKKDLGNGECEYTMWALTECAAWQKRDTFKFTEVCSKYNLSQVLSDTEVAQYR